MTRRLQGLLQALFMRVEALFNTAFGERHNPLYHLGEIGFYLFWIVVGTGLYLYAFFETGVAGAYSSVQALTHGQWYAGGILRSVHRHASDALVMVMLLHGLRHFAFDRHRGFRAFSWLTGVALIWLIYVSGINGYMLPWDRLAQFTIVAVFEWLDALPTFGGTLMRNFMYASSVNDRLFSLLAFMHIGVPLVALLLLFVHVQRVPKAKTLPPRPMLIGLAMTLLVLSMLRPALSQGGAADLGLAAGRLAFDWFYLALLPLLYEWTPAQVWLLVGAGSALLVVLPWWPLQRRDAARREARVTVHGLTAAPAAPSTLTVRAGETILDAGLRAGLALPYECRNGACGLCVCTVLQGRVEHGAYQPAVLTEAMRHAGQALLCCAKPLGDVAIELQEAPDARAGSVGPWARLPVRQHEARIEQIEHVTPDLMRLRLALLGEPCIAFRAGQYINILLDDGQRRAFSFANPPQHNDHIELHVRRIPGGRFTGWVFSQMKVGDRLRFEGPLGDFTLRDSPHPILFVAGATGFAPVKCIVEDAFARGVQRPMSLYWGVRQASDLYARELAEQWQRAHANFRFVPVLSDPERAGDWQGRTGLVHEAMLADFPDLRDFEVYVCGSVKMVEAAVPAFLAQGLDDGLCFTDAFLPSPQKPGAAAMPGVH